jgi:hypothetical protein
MMMIEKVTGVDFVKDIEITDIKPQALIVPIISIDVPYTFAPPRSTCSGTAPPPPTSSSTGSILRVLKSIFYMFQDTRQHQDVLISKHHQNDKLGLNEFDEFPLHEPPLDEDPFSFISPTDLSAMGDAPTADDDGNEYEDDEDDEDDDE